jgi:hypothetical protein
MQEKRWNKASKKEERYDKKEGEVEIRQREAGSRSKRPSQQRGKTTQSGRLKRQRKLKKGNPRESRKKKQLTLLPSYLFFDHLEATLLSTGVLIHWLAKASTVPSAMSRLNHIQRPACIFFLLTWIG